MRFHLGAIPSSPDFVPDGAWTPLREPSPWVFQLLAVPIGLGIAALMWLLWSLVISWQLLKVNIPEFFLAFVGVVIAHELIHAATHPQAGRSTHSLLGFWPSRILFYAHYDGEVSRNRFLAIFLMPLLVISIAPLIVAAVAQTASVWVAFISSFNALLACGDVLGAGMVLCQIPAAATVRNQGWRTYWKS